MSSPVFLFICPNSPNYDLKNIGDPEWICECDDEWDEENDSYDNLPIFSRAQSFTPIYDWRIDNVIDMRKIITIVSFLVLIIFNI